MSTNSVNNVVELVSELTYAEPLLESGVQALMPGGSDPHIRVPASEVRAAKAADAGRITLLAISTISRWWVRKSAPMRGCVTDASLKVHEYCWPAMLKVFLMDPYVGMG